MAEAQDQLQKLTECSICFKTFTDPRMLPCIHTFCLECLKETGKASKKKDGGNLACPLCRNLFVIPTEGIYHLRKNFFMQHLIDVTTIIQVGQKSVVHCDICKAYYEGDEEKTKEAVMRCFECGDNFCDMCAKMHKLHKSSKSHSIVKIGSETGDDIRTMQPTRHCAVHNQQPLNFYCADCKKIICVSCFVETHASHKCKDVTSVEKEFRQTIEMNALKISNFAEEMVSIAREAEQRASEVLLNLAETEEQIRQRNVEFKEMIDSHTNSLLDQLSLVKQKHVKDTATDKEEKDRIRTIFNSFKTYCTELSSKGSAGDICDCFDELVARANELEDDHDAFIFFPYETTEVSFKATHIGKRLSDSQSNIVGQIQEVKFQQGQKNTRGNNYFNAVIQCLRQTLLVEELSSRFISEQPLTEAFVTLLNTCKDSPEQNEALFNMYKLLYKSSPKFRNIRKHGSHDNFIQFLTEIRSEERDNRVHSSWFNDDPRKVLTTVDKVFGGHFITMYACLKCNKPNFVCEYLLDISLPISNPTRQCLQIGVRSEGPRPMWFKPDTILTAGKSHKLGHGSHRGKHKDSAQVYLEALNEEQKTPINEGGRRVTLTECLRLYTLTEHILESHRCVFCQKRQDPAAGNSQTMPSAMKQTLIYNPPAVLVLHIKRFAKTDTGFTKRSDRVAYEEHLDLGPYCSSDCLRIDPEDKNAWYSLHGVIVHNGSVESGHYSAYVKIKTASAAATKAYLQKTYLDCDEVSSQQLQKLYNPGKPKNLKVEYYPISSSDLGWTFTDEDNTREATLQEALNQEAFMLFYERVPCDQLLARPYFPLLE